MDQERLHRRNSAPFFMLLALLVYPESELAKCPILNTSIITASNNHQNVLGISINDSRFHLNLHIITSPFTGGSQLVLLGLVFDVTSAQAFYGPGKPYNLLASGKDVTRALLKSSLAVDDMHEDVSDIPKGEFREKLKQWLPFFLNKYVQVGVVKGMYFDSHGNPSALFLEYTNLLQSTIHQASPAPVPVSTEQCIFTENPETVSCAARELRPKIKRSRGKGSCVCVDENEAFSVKSDDHVFVHFQNCTEDGSVCTVYSFELVL